MSQSLTFHSAQSAIAKDTHRFRVLCCGRRFGKTTLAVWEMVGCALALPGRKIAYLAPTYQQARDIAWAELKKICAPIAVNINESRLEIEIRTNTPDTNEEGDPLTSTIILRGWEAVETLRGQKFDLLVLDEVASMRNFFTGWDEVLSPTLIDNKGSAMFISTPKGFNHFYELFKFEAKNPDYKSFHYTTYDNPHIPPEEIERERLTKTEDAFAQEYMADFRKTEGLVYKEFDRKKHVISASQMPPAFVEILGGIDPGFTHPTALLSIGKDKDSRYFIFKEWYHRGKTDAEIADHVAAQRFNRVYADPENASFGEELKRRGVNTRTVNKGPGSIVAGINVVRELLKSNRLYVSAECENTIMEWETYSYAESKTARDPKENPAKEFDDAMDAMRYVLMTDSLTSSSRGPSVAYSNHHGYGLPQNWNTPTPKPDEKGFTVSHQTPQSYGTQDIWDIKP